MKTLIAILLLTVATATAQTPYVGGLVTTNFNYTNKLWASALNAQTSTGPRYDASSFKSLGAWAGGYGDVWNSTGAITVAFGTSPNGTNFTGARYYLSYTQNGTNYSFGSTNWTLGNDEVWLLPLSATNAGGGNVTNFVIRPVWKSYPRN
jgi:hypothetical protein